MPPSDTALHVVNDPCDGVIDRYSVVLRAIAEPERHGPLTPSELARIERIKRPTATRTLGVLEEAGLLDRAPDPSDGRSSLVSINAAGRERLRRLRSRKNAYLARRMRDLPESDVVTLERAAEILEGILEERR